MQGNLSRSSKFSGNSGRIVDELDRNRATHLTCSQLESFCIVRIPENVFAIASSFGSSPPGPNEDSPRPIRGVVPGSLHEVRQCPSHRLPVSSAADFLFAGEGHDQVHLSIDASKAGAKIDRNLFGQFAENLGHGLYEGIWVGPDSSIPNTRGIRNDVVTALRGAQGAQCPLAGRLLCGRVPLAQWYRPRRASGRQRSTPHGAT